MLITDLISFMEQHYQRDITPVFSSPKNHKGGYWGNNNNGGCFSFILILVILILLFLTFALFS